MNYSKNHEGVGLPDKFLGHRFIVRDITKITFPPQVKPSRSTEIHLNTHCILILHTTYKLILTYLDNTSVIIHRLLMN